MKLGRPVRSQLRVSAITSCGPPFVSSTPAAKMAAGELFANLERLKWKVYAVTGVALGITSLPHIFPSILMPVFDTKKEVPPELQAHVKNIATTMHIRNPDRIKVYIYRGLRNTSTGSTLLPNGASIGLSRLVLCEDGKELQTFYVTFKGKKLDWELEETHGIANLLVPTAQEINFAIAHELAHIQHMDFVFRSALLVLAIIVTYKVSCKAPQYFRMNQAIVRGLTILLGIFSYSELCILLCRWQEYRADYRAAMCGHSYKEGGILALKKRSEFIQKLGIGKKTSEEYLVLDHSAHPTFQDRLERLAALDKHEKEGHFD